MKKLLIPALRCLVSASLLGCLLGWMEPVQAQIGGNTVYLIVASDDTEAVVALNPADGRQETLFSVPASARGGLPDLLPAEELDALNRYLIDYNATTRHPIASIADLHVRAWVHGIAASPDNRQVVAKVEYQTCFIPQNPVCFGTTHLVLIDRDTQDQRVLLNLGMHDSQLLPFPYIEPDPEMDIGLLQWASDQRALIVELSNRTTRRNVGDSAIIVVPVDGTTPFKIGEGRTWATRPSGNQIVILSKYDHLSNGVTNTLNFVDVDLETGQYSETSCVLEHYFIYDRGGLAFPGTFVVFQNSFDPTVFIEQDGGLAVFDTPTREATLVLPDQFFREIQASPDGAHLVFETLDHLLVEAHYEDGVMRLSPLTDAPVTDWNLGSEGSLIVQFAAGDPYSLFDPQGEPVEIPGLEDGIQAPQGAEIRAVDW